MLLSKRVFEPYHRAAAEGGDTAALRKLCALYRVNTLTALNAAQHGWLGASFSAVELLAVIYADFIRAPSAPPESRPALFLSKGHAAAAHYAVLAAHGAFPVERLLSYKEADGLPAHSDRAVPGVDADSGSLGMGLSKALGFALARAARPHPTFVVLGDGELQEGQVFESLLTLAHLRPAGFVVIVDRNGLQTDSPTSSIKDARDWELVFRGLGLAVERIDGHDLKSVRRTLQAAAGGVEPVVVIADTVKGYGTSRTAMPLEHTGPREGVWHGRIPTHDEYIALVDELIAEVDDPALAEEVRTARSRGAVPVAHPKESRDGTSTGAAFGDALPSQVGGSPDVVVLDADLEGPCRLASFAQSFPDRFVEVGISEQDMVSHAAGIALAGRIAIANTYASFYKRAVEQVAACAAEGLAVVFVGHYAGLDYFTDGKSHQSLEDVGLFRALETVDVFEPLTPGEVEPLLAHVLARLRADLARGARSRPVYLRLHRTPARLERPLPHAFAPGQPYHFDAEHSVAPDARLFASGPHMLALALEVAAVLGERGVVADAVGVSSFFQREDALTRLTAGPRLAVTLESHRQTGGLADWIAAETAAHPLRFGAHAAPVCTRRLADSLAVHGLTAPRVAERIESVLRAARDRV
ncbi:MAG: 1-deoxy-D-xylulose-5-phosphate synthase N-terminal domain-containing protein [Planctomycetota bacterium]